MPRAFDKYQLSVDRNPLQGLLPEIGKLPKLDPLDPADLLNTYLTSIERITGIDLRGIAEFFGWFDDEVGLQMQGFGAAWNQLVNGITNAFNEAEDVINATVAQAVAAIEGIFGVAKDSKLSADNANISVQALRAELAGGGFDEFDYESANALPSGLYEVTYGGPGAGNYGPNGSGYLVWKPSGALVREVLYRRTDTTLGGNNGVVTVVWASKPYDALLGGTFGYIMGRVSNTTNNTHIRAKIDNESARIEAVISGTATQIGSTKSLTVNPGDVWEFYYGTPAHPRRFWLRQNGVTVLDVTDGAADGSGAVSAIGSAYRSVGLGCYVDNYLIVGQNPAPSLAGWTWALQTEGS